MKKRGKLALPLILVFIACVAGYFLVFNWIEHRRTFKGPWLVDFNSSTNQVAIAVTQPTLGLTNVQIRFPGASAGTNVAQRLEFSQARPVPFDLPFGQCVFQDTTFLPGTIAFKMFGHQIQLMPRVLTIDGEERPWKSGEAIDLK